MINEEKKKIIIEEYENGMSLNDICKKHNMSSKSYIANYVLSGKTRSLSESLKIAHKTHQNAFKHTDETKRKMREKRLAWIKEHPEQTAWRLKNMSYPEKCFQKMLEHNKLDEKYLIYREYSVYPYFIDFAFINEKIAIEIDGSQHLKEDRKKKDEEKDKLLMSNGWKILRIAANDIIHNSNNVFEKLTNMLVEPSITYETVGVLKAPKKYEKVARGEDGLSDKERLRAFNQRIVERPSKEELIKLLQESNFTAVGRKYGVTDNAIRRWCKTYKIPHRKKDMQTT